MKEWATFFPLIASLTIQVRFTNMAACEGKKNFTVQRRGLLKNVKFTLRITSFWTSSIAWYSKEHMFLNWICFCHQVKACDAPTLIGLLEQAVQ
jgi:hypothetical protein